MDADRIWVFDLDDTLYPERDYVLSALRFAGGVAGDTFGLKSAVQEMVVDFTAGEKDPIGALWRRHGLPDAARAQLVAALRGHRPAISLRPGAAEFLSRLREAGRPFAIVTDGRSLTQRLKIAALRVGDARVVSISGETGCEKPNEGAFRPVVEAFPGAHFTYVADNPSKDFIAPKRLGWQSVMLRDPGDMIHPQPARIDPDNRADTVIADLSDLHDML